MNIPDNVVAFVQEHIHSVLQLEVLLLLYADGGAWTAVRIANEMRIPEQMAESHVHDLELRGLLEREPSSDSYRFATENPEVSVQVAALAEAYRDMRHSVINLIFSAPGGGARSLADAFRIRKRKDE